MLRSGRLALTCKRPGQAAGRGCPLESFSHPDRESDLHDDGHDHPFLPLPRSCPNCRYRVRLEERNPVMSWTRKCDCAGKKSKNGLYENTITHFHGEGGCAVEFKTSYSPDRPEIVYCEKCYQQEVY